jgi:hypothetical protein
LLAKGFSPPLIEANAELTGILVCHICTLWLHNFLLVSISHHQLKSCIVTYNYYKFTKLGHERPSTGWAGVAPRKKKYIYISPVSQEQRNKQSFLINYRNIVASKGSAGKDRPSQVQEKIQFINCISLGYVNLLIKYSIISP